LLEVGYEGLEVGYKEPRGATFVEKLWSSSDPPSPSELRNCVKVEVAVLLGAPS